MEFKKLISREDRAVSPVIGVILMVAITVILAAVIGAFVLGLGNDISSSQAPTMSTSVSHNSDYDPDASGDVAVFYIAHTAGDSIDTEDLRVVVRNEDGAEYASFDSSQWGNVETLRGSSPDGANITISGQSPDDVDEFGSGDTITIRSDGEGDPGAFEGDEVYTIQIVHTSSGSTVSEGTAEL